MQANLQLAWQRKRRGNASSWIDLELFSHAGQVQCTSCREPCVLRTANTEANRGRKFYKCQNLACGFFAYVNPFSNSVILSHDIDLQGAFASDLSTWNYLSMQSITSYAAISVMFFINLMCTYSYSELGNKQIYLSFPPGVIFCSNLYQVK